MKISVITIFPQIISDYCKTSIIARAIKKKLVQIDIKNLRDFAADAHKTVDDRPYGGGFGMVLKPDVLYKAIKSARGRKNSQKNSKARIIMLTPQGKTFNQKHAKRLSSYKHLVLVCGRYEGFDERARSMADEELSIGDYILMGGELAALVVMECVSRLIPGVVGKHASVISESFSENILEYPQYTRPEVLKVSGRNLSVPKILLSGDHAKIKAWRAKEALKRTRQRRPELLSKSGNLRRAKT